MEEHYQNAYKYLIEPQRSSGEGWGGVGWLRCAPALASRSCSCSSHATPMEDEEDAVRSSMCFVSD